MDTDRFPSVEAKRLADMLDAEQQPQRLWRPEELGAILRHQLSSVIQFDLGGIQCHPDVAIGNVLRITGECGCCQPASFPNERNRL